MQFAIAYHKIERSRSRVWDVNDSEDNVEIKQDFNMEPVISYRLRGRWEGGLVGDYEGEITWFSGGNRGGTSRLRQSIRGGL